MKLPRVRCTVRRTMVAVAICAAVIWTAGMRQRRADYLRLVAEWARTEEHFTSVADEQEAYADRDRSVADRYEAWAKTESDPRRVNSDMDLARRHGENADKRSTLVSTWRSRAAYASRLRRKYDRAARYPWLPVAPDPPEPE